MKKVVIAVEYGWRGMRELSLSLSKQAYNVDVFIKGRVPKEVLGMITTPKGMRLIDAPRPLFRMLLVIHCIKTRCLHKSLWVITQRRETEKQERTRQWLEALAKIVPFTLLLFSEIDGKNRLMQADGKEIDSNKLDLAVKQ